MLTPKRGCASTVTVNAVPSEEVLRSVCGCSRSRSQCSPVSDRQTVPRPWVKMKFIAVVALAFAASVQAVGHLDGSIQGMEMLTWQTIVHTGRVGLR